MVFMLAWWIFHLLVHIPRLMSFNITFVSIMTFHLSFSSWGLLYLCILQHREITDCVLLLYSVLLTSDIVPCRRHRTGWDSEKKILGITLLIQLSYHDYGTELIQLTCHDLGNVWEESCSFSPRLFVRWLYSPPSTDPVWLLWAVCIILCWLLIHFIGGTSSESPLR